MAVPRFCCVKVVVPKEATATSVVDTGVICSSLDIAIDINERCAPLLKSIFARVLISLAMIGATAVLWKQVVRCSEKPYSVMLVLGVHWWAWVF